MKKVILVASLALVLVGLFAGTQTASAANGYEQWTGGYSDGCYYYWDGFAYTSTACPRADSGYDFYFPGNGRWEYSFSAGFMTDGGVWLIYQGQTYIQGGPAIVNDQSTTFTVGPASWSGLTGNVLVDQIMFESNQAIIDTILRPTCIEVVGNTCYY